MEDNKAFEEKENEGLNKEEIATQATDSQTSAEEKAGLNAEAEAKIADEECAKSVASEQVKETAEAPSNEAQSGTAQDFRTPPPPKATSDSQAASGFGTRPAGSYPPPPPPPRQQGFEGARMTGGFVPPRPQGAPQGYAPYGTPGAYPPPYNPAMSYAEYAAQKKKKKPVWLFVLLGVIGFFALIAIVAGIITAGSSTNVVGAPSVGENYVAVLHIDGEIAGDYVTTSMYGTSGTYNQVYLIDMINALIGDHQNVGIMLYINSPGGELIATDELARTITYYKEQTGRPVYAYFADYAASGAYWLGCQADVIIAHKYCVTGSIGVTYGTHIDISGLLQKLGIDATTLASGENKGMGSMYEPLSDEQKAIYREQLEEMHDSFVKTVAEGRAMDESAVRKIADGSTMLASKALKLGLVDHVGYYSDARAIMIKECNYATDIVFYDCIDESYRNTLSLSYYLEADENEAMTEDEALAALIKKMEENRKFMVKYEG